MDPKQFVFDTSEHAAIIQCFSEKLMAFYVFPDTADEICACLQKHLDGGDYITTTEGELFALALTLHMQEVRHDDHRTGVGHPVQPHLAHSGFALCVARACYQHTRGVGLAEEWLAQYYYWYPRIHRLLSCFQGNYLAGRRQYSVVT